MHRLWRTATGAPSEAGPPSGRAALATVAAGKGGLRIVALDPAARALGMRPGMSLADARALSPTLAAVPADPPAERRELSALADWCCRYTPWAAIDKNASHPGKFGGGAGVWLDTSGCAHLFGGEETMLRDLLARLEGIGFAATAAIAGTAGAAWAIARFESERIAVLPEGSVAAALAPLSVRGLRLPLEVATALRRMGLRRIGDLLPLPRASLAARFDDLLLRRLDQALGRMDEPLCPRRPAPAFRARLAFAEPIGRAEDMALALRYLLVDLCARLEAAQKGARRLELAAFRADGKVERAAVGTSRPTRTPDHLRRLFGEKLEQLDPGFGIEVMTLGALVVDPLPPAQAAIGLADDAVKAESLAQLIDRLGNRLGSNAVVRLAGHPSHVPERACREVPAMSDLSSPQVPSPQPSPDGRGRRAVRGDCSLPPLPSPDGRGRRAVRGDCSLPPLPSPDGRGGERSERVREKPPVSKITGPASPALCTYWHRRSRSR